MSPGAKSHFSKKPMEPTGYLEAFTPAQLNERARAEALILWRKHRKLEIVAGAIAGPVSGFLFGAASYLFGTNSQGLIGTAVLSGAVAAITIATITLAIIYGFYRFIEAPRTLYFNAEKRLLELSTLLQSEKAKNAAPELAGRVDCLEVDVKWDLENYGIDEKEKLTLKAVFTLKVTVWNDSIAPTTVSGFLLDLLWDGGGYLADPLPVEPYLVRQSVPRSEGDEWGYEKRLVPLVAFPNDVEITTSNHATGWLRFLTRGTPAVTSETPDFRNDVTWRLRALDRKGREHGIYQGKWDLPPCGSIERNEPVWVAV